MTPDFAAAFRQEAFRTLEYSIGEEPSVLGALVGGESPSFAARALAFARRTSFGGTWASAAGELVRRVPSTAYLFRVDARLGAHAPLAISLYANFPEPMQVAALGEVLACIAPLRWHGPSPHELARIAGLEAPTGIGLRVDARERYHVAFYFRSALPFRFALRDACPRLVHACGYGEHVLAQLCVDLPELRDDGALGIVGVDSGETDGSVGSLKFDPPHVPIDHVLRFLRRRSVSGARLRQLHQLAISLRSPAASYLGLKYRGRGLESWKLYFAISQRRASRFGDPVIVEHLPTVFFSNNPS